MQHTPGPVPPPRLQTAAGRLILDGAPWLMRAAEFHYFRIAPERWAPGLARLAALGFNAVSTYVPWIWHEPAPGQRDFSGIPDLRRDVLGSPHACRAAGLPLIVRPGPFIYAEYQGLGHPRWLEQAIPEALMRGPRGKPVRGAFWAAYSLGHPAYRAAVAGWYGAVAGAFAGLWNDPILAWQLDNETGFLYANGLGKWDWNPDTVARFHAWLRGEYGTVARLNAAWGARYPDFAAIGPPRVPFRRGLTQDYQRFLEAWIDDYLAWLRDTAQDAGVPVPLSHNDSANFIPPVNPARKIAAGVVELPGYDLYVKMTGARPATDYPWGSACASAYFRAVTPPALPLLAWELGAGWFDPRARLTDAALLNNLVGALAQGLQGFALYIAHDAVEVEGHPYSYQTVLDAAGQPGPRYAIMQRLLAFLHAHEADLLAAGPPGPPRDSAGASPILGFAFHYADFRFTPEDFLPLIGLQDPARILALVMSPFGIYAALLAAGYGPILRLINLETVRPADLAACTAVVMPNRAVLAPATLQMLEDYVQAGGHLITCGRTPRRTLTGAPLPSRRLYPAPVQRTRFLGRLPALLYLGWEWLVKYQLFERPRLRRRHPTSMHIIDLGEPLYTLFYAPQFGSPLQRADGATVRGDYLRQTYRLPDGATPQLWTHGACAGYTGRNGAGSSTMIGSMPGGSYFTAEYYRLDAATRRGIRAFWQETLAPFGLAPPVALSGDLEIEVTHRPFAGGGLLFLLNRGPEPQRGTIRFGPAAGVRGAAQVIFAATTGQAVARGADALDVDLPGNEVLILRWTEPGA